jgi:hypothetical protein
MLSVYSNSKIVILVLTKMTQNQTSTIYLKQNKLYLIMSKKVTQSLKDHIETGIFYP